MPMPITANTFNRAFSSSSNFIINARDYTDSVRKELKRVIISMLTFGLSEVWHARHADQKMHALIPILKEMAYTEIVEGQNKVLELESAAGHIRIIQMINSNGADYLEATLDGVKIDMREFTTIRALQKSLKADLANHKAVADLYQNDKEIKEISRINESSVTLQKFIRFYNVLNVKEPKADVPALRNSKGIPIAYKILPDDQGHFPYVAFPGEKVPIPSKGSYKALTHRTPETKKNRLTYVAFTLENCDTETLDPRFLTVISEHNLDKIKPQIRVNQYQLMAEDLGQFDLSKLIDNNLYTFDPLHFKAWQPI